MMVRTDKISVKSNTHLRRYAAALLPTPPEGGKEVPLFILKSVQYLSLCNPLECGMGLSFEFRDYLASLPLSAETVSTNEHINLS